MNGQEKILFGLSEEELSALSDEELEDLNAARIAVRSLPVIDMPAGLLPTEEQVAAVVPITRRPPVWIAAAATLIAAVNLHHDVVVEAEAPQVRRLGGRPQPQPEKAWQPAGVLRYRPFAQTPGICGWPGIRRQRHPLNFVRSYSLIASFRF